MEESRGENDAAAHYECLSATVFESFVFRRWVCGLTLLWEAIVSFA